VYDVSALFMLLTGRHFWLRVSRDLIGPMTETLTEKKCSGAHATSEGWREARMHRSELRHPSYHGIFTASGAGRGVRHRAGRSKLAATYARANTPLRRGGSKRIVVAGLRRGDVGRSGAIRMQ
jgi:hypothetical protein